jgi:PAS domain S-box-containing protein
VTADITHATILIVDDDAAQLDALCGTLIARGYAATGFASGELALVELRTRKFDLLLTDLVMPGTGGIELLHAATKIDADIGGIVMTGHGAVATAVAAIQAGALDYVVKPFDLSTILAVLTRALQLRRLRIELRTANAELEAFSYSAGHDLKAPLLTARGFLKVLGDELAGQMNATARGYLEQAAGSIARVQEIAEKMVRFSQAGRADVTKSPSVLSAIVESAPTAMLMVDREGLIVLMNAETEELFGYRRDEVVGRSVEILIPNRFRGLHPAYRTGLFAQPQARRMGAARELFGMRKDGSEFPIEVDLKPIQTEHGLFVLSAVFNITQRKRLESRISSMVEAAPMAMVMVDRKGCIVLVNADTEKLFGYRRDELLGRPIEVLLPQRFQMAHPALREEFFQAPDARRTGAGRDLFAVRKDGSEFPVEIGLNPLDTDEGMFVLSGIVDVTERKRAEEILHKKTEELARSNQDLEQFAYVASHDLQEPLRAVSGSVQLLQRRYGDKLDARADEYIAHAVDGAARMQELIRDLLAYSRVGRTEDPLQTANCDVALDQALKNLRTAIEESGITVTRDTLPIVRGIPAQLSLLFQNLIGNAVKFRRKDQAAHVHIAARACEANWELSVTDDGIGIDPQHFERIFVIFQRLNRRREYPGTGIGLALCKRIIERHGGRIRVESSQGTGTTFSFTLLRTAALSAAGQQQAASPSP